MREPGRIGPMGPPHALLAACLGLAACSAAPRALDVQGHRGARALAPENTVPSFLLALDLGVTTLEVDVVASADGAVVASHDPWFDAKISSYPDGRAVRTEEERSLVLLRMTYAEIAAFDVGRRGHPLFPDQAAIPAVKPLLEEVVAAADAHAEARGRPLPRYNVEIKSRPEWDGFYTPPPDVFAALVREAVARAGATERTTIQSFDVRPLQALRRAGAGLQLALLVASDHDLGLAENLARLGFTPDVYSPEHELVDAALVRACHARGMRIVPWTVNDRARMEALVALGVDGVITDDPRLAAGLGPGPGTR